MHTPAKPAHKFSAVEDSEPLFSAVHAAHRLLYPGAFFFSPFLFWLLRLQRGGRGHDRRGRAHRSLQVPRRRRLMLHFLGVKDYSEWDYFKFHIAKPLKKAKNNGNTAPEYVLAKVRKLTDMTMLVRKNSSTKEKQAEGQCPATNPPGHHHQPTARTANRGKPTHTTNTMSHQHNSPGGVPLGVALGKCRLPPQSTARPSTRSKQKRVIHSLMWVVTPGALTRALKPTQATRPTTAASKARPHRTYRGYNANSGGETHGRRPDQASHPRPDPPLVPRPARPRRCVPRRPRPRTPLLAAA